MMLYFLGIVTGSIASLLTNWKVKNSMVLEAAEEETSTTTTQNLIEEDVICHEHHFGPIVSNLPYYLVPISFYKTPPVLDVTLSMVAPPPERA